MAQVFEILPSGRQGPDYLAYSTMWLQMISNCKVPGHQHPWCWPSYSCNIPVSAPQMLAVDSSPYIVGNDSFAVSNYPHYEEFFTHQPNGCHMYLFHKGFMRSWLKSENTVCCNHNSDDQIRSEIICSCHDSWAFMTCAKLWPDYIIIVHTKQHECSQNLDYELI